MPTFTAIALDRLLEPSTVDTAAHDSLPMPNSLPRNQRAAELDRRGTTLGVKTKPRLSHMTPALYATPDVTPLPDSPTLYSPSPYVVNHKRRGPRLLKSYSENGVTDSLAAACDEEKCGLQQNGHNPITASVDDIIGRTPISKVNEVKGVNGVNGSEVGRNHMQPGNVVWEVGNGSLNDDLARGAKSPMQHLPANENIGDGDDFYDPHDSLSYASNPEDDNYSLNAGNSAKLIGDFFDAWEELSSDSGRHPSSIHLEDELREIRFSLLVEIEKRKQAEEALGNMQSQWQKLKQELSLVGLTLPAYPNLECEQLAVEAGEDLRDQVIIARFVADAIGRGRAKAEVETDMEALIETKNFEIARLVDRLRYYEAANREMSQRNQKAFERARRLREEKKKRRKQLIRGSVVAALSLGAAALIWSLIPARSGSSSTSHSLDQRHAKEAK